MNLRAMWKAELVLGTERLGVKLYAAAQDKTVRFHLLHARDGARVRQRMAHPGTGKTVDPEDIRRGVEVRRGRFLELSEDDRAAIVPEESREVEVFAFIPPDVLGPHWYDRPYYLGPEDGEDRDYRALVAALDAEERVGLARWTMRKRSYTGVLCSHAERLAFVTLRGADEVLDEARLEAPEGRAWDKRELDLASQLIETLAGPFDITEYHDQYRERVEALIEKKRKGKPIELRRYKARPAADASLLESLEASLRKAS